MMSNIDVFNDTKERIYSDAALSRETSELAANTK